MKRDPFVCFGKFQDLNYAREILVLCARSIGQGNGKTSSATLGCIVIERRLQARALLYDLPITLFFKPRVLQVSSTERKGARKQHE